MDRGLLRQGATSPSSTIVGIEAGGTSTGKRCWRQQSAGSAGANAQGTHGLATMSDGSWPPARRAFLDEAPRAVPVLVRYVRWRGTGAGGRAGNDNDGGGEASAPLGRRGRAAANEAKGGGKSGDELTAADAK